MKISIIGYGKMGKGIHKIALEKGLEVSYCISSKNISEIDLINKDNTDVALEFSTPNTVVNNLKKLIYKGLPIVVGTTGWEDDMESIKQLCKEKKGTLLYASNFSLGVNIMFQLNKQLVSMMSKYSDIYNIFLEEWHHIQKLDKPSGTAITLASEIQDTLGIDSWKLADKPLEDRVAIKSYREGSIIGKHSVTYDSDIDTITIKHNAKNRLGFYMGVIQAAQFLQKKKGIYTMQDVIQSS